jgi:hypothetical protein
MKGRRELGVVAVARTVDVNGGRLGNNQYSLSREGVCGSRAESLRLGLTGHAEGIFRVRPFEPKVVGSIPTAPTMQLVDMQWFPLRLGHIWPQNLGYFVHGVSLFRSEHVSVNPHRRTHISVPQLGLRDLWRCAG